VLPEHRSDWPSDRLRLVVAHELIHVQRNDCLIQILMQIACALYWCNPLMWFAYAQFRKDSERACDDGVLNLGVAAPDYAGHLLDLARSLQPSKSPALAVAMAHQSQLESRLVALLDERVNRTDISRKAAAFTMLIAALIIVPLVSAQAQTPNGTGVL